LSAVVDPGKIGILLIDAQPAFLDSMHGQKEPLLVRLERLLLLANLLKLPLIATFEHPVETKGWLPERLEKVFPAHAQKFVKKTFNVCSDPSINRAIKTLSVKQFALAGGETDVCVMQSALGLLALGLQVFLLEDSIFTSEHHPRPALERMYRAGVIPCTFKSMFYELLRTVDEALPENVRDGIRSLPAEFSQVEKLPPWQQNE
jgi:nicotinamidase-related amidase